MKLPTHCLPAALGAALMLAPALAAAEDLTVGMPTSPPNVVHMPVYLAQDLGLYKKYGITVKIVSLNGGVNVFRAMLAGNLDTARSHEIMDLLIRLNEDLGLTIVMVTHEADIAAYAQRTIRFLDGHVASDTLKLEAA